jgi:hypothetical protein
VGIGGSIFLIAVGAILTFAVHIDAGWLNLQVVGWVLMLAGAFGLILTLYFWNSRRRQVVKPLPPVDDPRIVEEHHRVTARHSDLARHGDLDSDYSDY